MKYLLSFIFLIFLGCSTKTTPIFLTFKFNNFAISDQGFLEENSFYKKILVYSNGVSVLNLKITKDSIYVNNKKYPKNLFIKNINPLYPSDILEKIIDKKPIFDKVIYTKDGFIQKTKNIFYKVDKDSVFFRDKKNHFLIKIRYLKG